MSHTENNTWQTKGVCRHSFPDDIIVLINKTKTKSFTDAGVSETFEKYILDKMV